jgi:hypothetical protein
MTRPRPLREGDTLGRAGRVGPNGGRVETARARDMTAEDERRATVNDWDTPGGVSMTGSLIVYQPPGDGVSVSGGDRALLSLDGSMEPRPPKAWEEANAALRSSVGELEREAATRERVARRRRLPVDQSLTLALQALLTLQTPRAKQVRETDARSAVAGAGVPQGEGHGAVGFLQEAEVDGRLAQVRAHVDAIWDAIDAHHGLAHRSYQMMGGEEKDALITGRTFRGMAPEAIHAIHPELGSAKHIRYVRSCAGQNGRGEPKREAA